MYGSGLGSLVSLLWNGNHLISTNFDGAGAMFHDTNEVGIRVVVWNANSEVMASLSEKIFKPSFWWFS